MGSCPQLHIHSAPLRLNVDDDRFEANPLRGSLIDTCNAYLGPKLLDNAAVETLEGSAGKVATGLDDDCIIHHL